jgi:hypothetical protein
VGITRAESGFDMTDRNLRVEGRERPAHSSGGISLNQDYIGSGGGKYWFEAGEDSCRNFSESLARAHGAKVEIGSDAENLEHLVEQLSVLGSNADLHIKLGRILPHCEHDRAQLHCLRASTEDKQNPFTH